MDILKNPLICAILGGVSTLTVTTVYNVYSPQVSNCDTQIETVLNELRQELVIENQRKEADIIKALAPNPTPLDDDREGGLNWN